jgi:hypothetical protein
MVGRSYYTAVIQTVVRVSFCYRLVSDNCIYDVYIHCFFTDAGVFRFSYLILFLFLFLRSLGFRILRVYINIVHKVMDTKKNDMLKLCFCHDCASRSTKVQDDGLRVGQPVTFYFLLFFRKELSQMLARC